MTNDDLNFKISTGLKNIIGKELINDKFIAVFELIKNSYDAGATRVDVTFENFATDFPQIIIQDNGCGMSYDDIKNKWLFVGYSEKKEENQTEEYKKRFKRKAAGAKGVGRFSCDRLGSELAIYTKTKEAENVHNLVIDWDKFEEDDKKEFINIKLKYQYIRYLKLDDTGTKITISNLRESWNDNDLVKLKKSIMKIINPVDEEDDSFKIYFKVTDTDDHIYNLKSSVAIKNNGSPKISGIIENDVFEKLNIKTTNIQVRISEDGSTIISRLEDRGSFIYEMKEKNPFIHLKSIKVFLYVLNKSAKASFTRIMGIEPVKYGSIFVYKNNFRVYPYGEPGNDFFDMDQRKAQGYNRHLGTREVMGRITIKDNNKCFIETSSRNAGFIKTREYGELIDFFKEKVLKPLEKYTVDIIKWGELTKEEEINKSREIINPEDVTLDVIEKLIGGRSKNENILDIEYNKDLIQTLEVKSKDNLASTINKIEKLALESGGKELVQISKALKQQAKELHEGTIASESKIKEIEKEKDLREQQAKNLKSFVGKDKEIYAKTLHTIGIDALTIKEAIENIFNEFPNLLKEEKLKNKLISIHRLSEKIEYGIKLSNRANFDLNASKISTNLGEYFEGYCNNVLTKSSIPVLVKNNDLERITKFDPREIVVLLENIISNSKKESASIIFIDFKKIDNKTEMQIYNNGNPAPDVPDLNELFEFGVSTGGGTGIGLYHIKSIVEKQLRGEISIDKEYKNGFKLRIIF